MKSEKNFMKKALITGITGQDGSYLAELLLEKGYEVHGIKRRSSMFNTQSVDHIYEDPHVEHQRFKLHYGDLTDTSNIIRILNEVEPDEVYNLGAQSHVAVSFESPEYTVDVDGVGTLRLLEGIRILGLREKLNSIKPQLPSFMAWFKRRHKRKQHHFIRVLLMLRLSSIHIGLQLIIVRSYNMFACNGILFNHESPRRGETFVTRKITRGLARYRSGLEDCLYMGNIDALRDWGHAKDYVRMQWMMLQQDEPNDFVIATGKQYSVREFIDWSAQALGITLEFNGSGIDEVGVVVAIDGDMAPDL